MVLQGADESMRQAHHRGLHGYGDGQRQLREERVADQQYPLARQQPGVFSPTVERIHSAGRGAGGSFAAANVEEALVNMWVLEDADGALGGCVALPLSTPVSRKTDEALMEIRREQPRLQQCRSSQNAHGQPGCGATQPENSTRAGLGREGGLGPCCFATQPLNQHPLHQHQLQSQYVTQMPIHSMENEQQRCGRIIGIGEGNYQNPRSSGTTVDSSCNGAKTVGDCYSGGLGFGAGDWGGGITVGQMGGASPKSSISSDGSGGDMVGNSPAALWEVDMRRGASKGGGGGGGAGGWGKKRPLDATEEDIVGHWQQPQMITSSDSSASMCDRKQSIEDVKPLLCADMELESPIASNIKEDMLLQLLRITSLERDEARDQLQILLAKMAQARPPEPSPTHLRPDLLSTGRSPPQAHCFPPYTTFPMAREPLFDPVPAPQPPHKIMADSNNKAAAQQQAPLLGCTSAMPTAAAAEHDPASAIIDRLVLKRALPEKGKLLQAVMEAGPLLQTLLVAGSLPRWRNPPPLQPFHIPPVSVRGRESGILHQNAVSNQNYLVQSSPQAFQHQNSLVASQIYAASSMGSSGLTSWSLRAQTPSTCASSYHGPAGKRQKF